MLARDKRLPRRDRTGPQQPRDLPPFFDEGVHLTDADSAATDVGLAHQIVCDPPGFSLGHTYNVAATPAKAYC